MTKHVPSAARRRFLGCAAGTAALAGLAPYARAQQHQLSIGLLRAPASAIVDLSEQRGWFREVGLTLNQVLFAQAAGPKIVQALGGGSIGLSFVNSTAALLGMAGGAIPLRFVSIATDPSKLFAVLSQPAIDTVPKLAGKRVACTAGTGLHYYLARVLSKYGMTFKDIEFVNLPAAEGQAAFVAGRVDAVVPSVNGRFSIMNTKKDVRELFAYADFTKPPGSTQPFLNYDLFVTTEQVLQASRPAIRAFLQAYHDKGVPYLQNPATRPEALRIVTEYVNKEQKNPTDAAIMTQIMDQSGFYDAKTAKQLMTRDDFRANLDYQVKFFMDLGQMKSAPDLDKAIVTDLL
ncbi:MAG TPA: NrtA/SsuA/CpmA family ABC transporter substrate-binding protein [Casimicrobiaceae bacterium]|jgi:ABC-type nitrate/sulfonate/bicarbonate transport system substrate-binding protein|nr:NrtA/SsuA/CpmA family ABC transporter substrate-binding protein [Casimicrobiaceae bacterium]